MRIFLLLIIAFLNTAWTDRVQLSNEYGSDGSDKDPMYEKNFGYLFCETKEDAKRARMGQIDWIRSNSDNFCRFKHRNSDDTWKSGWERSRLFRGCKTQLNMFGNPVYRCYDSSKDPEILTLEKQLNQTKANEYADWQLAYQAKQKELLARAKELTGVDNIDAEIDAAKKLEEDLKVQQQQLINEADEASKTTEQFMEEFRFTEKNLSALSSRFDRDITSFSKLLESHHNLERQTENARIQIQSQLDLNRENWSTLQKLKDEWVEKIAPSLAVLCKDPALSRALKSSQSQVAYMNDLLFSLEEKYRSIQYTSRFAHLKQHLRSYVDKLRRYADSRDFVFDAIYESQIRTPSICESSNELRNAIDSASIGAEIIRQAKQASTIKNRLNELLSRASADRLQRISIFKVKSQQSLFLSSIYKGNVREAKEILDSISERMEEIVENSGLTPDSEQMKELLDEVRIVKEFIINKSYRIDNLSSADIVLDTKLKRVRTLIIKADMKSRQEPEFKEFWETQKVKIYEELNTSPGQKISMPRFTNWDDLLNHEFLLDQVEDVLIYLIEEKK